MNLKLYKILVKLLVQRNDVFSCKRKKNQKKTIYNRWKINVWFLSSSLVGKDKFDSKDKSMLFISTVIIH